MGISTEKELAHLCFSELTPKADLSAVDVLVVDSVGLLAKLYGLADIAFVGGSFRGSVHNVMEPAAMAKPIVSSVRRSRTLMRHLYSWIRVGRNWFNTVHRNWLMLITVWLKDDARARTTAGSIGKQLIEENLGAVARTLVHLRKYV